MLDGPARRSTNSYVATVSLVPRAPGDHAERSLRDARTQLFPEKKERATGERGTRAHLIDRLNFSDRSQRHDGPEGHGVEMKTVVGKIEPWVKTRRGDGFQLDPGIAG